MSPSPCSIVTRVRSITRTSRAGNTTSSPARWWKSGRIRVETLRRGPCSNKPFDEFAQQVGFQIDGATHLTFVQGRDLPGVRNDPNIKTPAPHRRHRQADAVHGDGTFENDIAHEIRRSGDLHDVIRAGFFPAFDAPQPVNVAADEMSAQAVADAQGALQINACSWCDKLQISAPPAFLEHREAQQFSLAPSADFLDRQATAIDRQAVARFK